MDQYYLSSPIGMKYFLPQLVRNKFELLKKGTLDRKLVRRANNTEVNSLQEYIFFI